MVPQRVSMSGHPSAISYSSACTCSESSVPFSEFPSGFPLHSAGSVVSKHVEDLTTADYNSVGNHAKPPCPSYAASFKNICMYIYACRVCMCVERGVYVCVYPCTNGMCV